MRGPFFKNSGMRDYLGVFLLQLVATQGVFATFSVYLLHSVAHCVFTTFIKCVLTTRSKITLF